MPSVQARENEVLGLVDWRTRFVAAVSFLALGQGITKVAIGIYKLWNGDLSLSFVEGCGYLAVACHAFHIRKYERQYVDSENEKDLIRAMWLTGDLWTLLGFVSVIPLAALAAGINAPLPFDSWAINMALAGVGAAFYGTILRRRLNRPPSNDTFVREIPNFARASVWKTRNVGIGFMVLGFVFLIPNVLTVDDTNLASSLSGVGLMGSLGYIAIGAAITFLWRRVREIHRNPSLIYFERTLERLNLFWLVAVGAMSVNLLATLFG